MAATRRAGVDPVEQRVVDAALALAGEVGWEKVRLSAVADRAGLALTEIGPRFRDVDAVANAWFARARLAMLALPAGELDGKPADERIALAFEAWLDALAPQRRVAAEILRHKLYPSHPHHWVPLVFDLSRLVHDLLDVARVPGAGRLRQAQEIGLTAITLATLAHWLRDDSPGQERSRRGLRRRLACAGRIALRIRSRTHGGAPTTSGEAADESQSSATASRRRGRGNAPA
jgi:AcrR family transcriptional regulator